MPQYSTEELERWIDSSAVDKSGQRLGTIVDVYIDDVSGQAEWLAVTTGLFGTRTSFVPLLGATPSGDKIQVAFGKSLVKDSPNMEIDGQLSQQEEERLYRHYGLAYSPRASDTEVIDTTVADVRNAGQPAKSE